MKLLDVVSGCLLLKSCSLRDVRFQLALSITLEMIVNAMDHHIVMNVAVESCDQVYNLVETGL